MPELNRRNVLIGMGGLAIGGGALLGSGAFTTVEADRDVQVNVLENNNIGDSDQFADVLIDVGGFASVAVDDGDEVNETGEGLFPDTDEYTDTDPSFGTDYVSLLQNDVTIVFGHEQDGDNRLLPNTTTSYEDLIALVNTNDAETEGFHTLEFGGGDFDQDNTDVEFAEGEDTENLQVGETEAEEFDVDVTSDEVDDTAEGDFVITITGEEQ